MDFLDYTNNIRLSHALADLQSKDKTMTYVALQNGFPNVASFNKVFKSTYGATPKQYMKNNKYLENYAEMGGTKPDDISKKVKKFLKGQFIHENPIHGDTITGKPIEIFSDAGENKLYVKSWCRMLNIGNLSSLEGAAMQEHVIILKQELKMR